MKSKLLFFDLAVCSVWMLSCLLGEWMSWFALLVPLRLVVSFSLYYREKRSWLPIGLVYMPILAYMSYMLMEYFRIPGWHDIGLWGYETIIGIISYSRILTRRLGCSVTLRDDIILILMLWLFIFPLVYYLCLLFCKRLERTSLEWKDMIGGILWHDRVTKTCSAILMVMLAAFLAGLSMDTPICLLMCLTAAPITYWLLCRYNKVRADRLWVLVISMCVFWYAQLLVGAWRASMLFVSFGLVVYVGTWLYRNTKNSLLAIASVLYLSILLPSYSIGYNQYVCLNYARKGFYHLASYPGILYVTDSTEKLYGLRDRYGLLVKPEYEKICENNEDNEIWSHVYIFQKDGYKRYYNAYNNTFKESDIEPELQHQVRELLEGYFAKNGGNCGNKGQITVMELLDGKTIADVRVTMWGNPFLCYTNESFLPDDSICVAHGDFYRNDSVTVDYSHILSYALHVPNDSAAIYRIYVRLATDSVPADSMLIHLAEKVATLKELQQ